MPLRLAPAGSPRITPRLTRDPSALMAKAPIAPPAEFNEYRKAGEPKVPADLAVGLSCLDALEEEPFDTLQRSRDEVRKFCVVRCDLESRIHQQAAFVVGISQRALQYVSEERLDRIAGWQCLATFDALSHAHVDVMIERGAKQGTLVAKGIVEAGRRKTGLIHEIFHRSRLVTATPETPERRTEDLFLIKLPRSRHPNTCSIQCRLILE